MIKELFTSLKLAGATIAICAVAYPLAILAFAAIATPEARLGSLVTNDDGIVLGSRLIAQSFTKPEYFWPRPSACDYNAAAAAGSNLSPANPAIRERAEEILARLEPGEGKQVPADLVTASGGGLDPHISYAAALQQMARVAKARGVDDNELLKLVEEHTEQIPLTSGEASQIVNVFELNIALDRTSLED